MVPNMSFCDIIDLSSDEETEAAVVEDVKPNIRSKPVQNRSSSKTVNSQENGERMTAKQKPNWGRQWDIDESATDLSRANDQKKTCLNGFSAACASAGSSMSLCRQFWKAGDYEVGGGSQTVPRDGKNHLRVHPKFLHSNATSHKWAFGAVAELLDNAVDEIQQGATFVMIDRISNLQNGSPALLMQDDGGGMNPESLRRCMSFGFSDKNSASSIGQYGNGFKTSTMRLGADVIVFSRCLNNGTSTQSVGLLSYTFLRQTGSDDIVVPMVDHELNPSSGEAVKLFHHGEKHFFSNLAAILKWSPFRTEADLMKQFDDIGTHGTKIIVFNLWFNDDGVLELDFDSKELDIMISGAPRVLETKNTAKKLTQNHIATQIRFSLRAYSSILYLHLPEYFRIILRGEVVQPHKLVSDLRFIECIKYTPNVAENKEAVFITTIGFLEGAPNLNIHGFNVYHKNRLILPFWRVVNSTNSKGRGVSGVLEANFIKPTHDKQDFEKSTLYYRLETRLKDMTHEYWEYHCHLVGYPNKRVSPIPSQPLGPSHQQLHLAAHTMVHTGSASLRAGHAPTSVAGRQVMTALHAPGHIIAVQTPISHENSTRTGFLNKRKYGDHGTLDGSLKRQAQTGVAVSPDSSSKMQGDQGVRQNRKEIILLMQENKSLLAECTEFEKMEKELMAKAEKLRSELEATRRDYDRLLTDEMKIEKL